MPLLQLLFYPMINDNLNLIAIGVYLTLVALIITFIYEARK